MKSLQEIWSNYNESFNFLQLRKQRQVKQLILLNNLQRGDENISSTMLITLFNRILANLYDDKMQVKFVPGEEVDQKKVNSLNILAQNDYREMDKARLDYDWNWDTLFFGRGYVETLQFDPVRKIMEPVVINPLVFGYDPYQADSQEWRYYWKWISKNKWQLKKLIAKGEITGVEDVAEIPTGMEPYLWTYKVERDQARAATATATEPAKNDVYQILEFYGYNDDGKKCVYWVDKNFSKILMERELDLKDGEDGDSRWPIVVKEAYREPHSSVVFSVADLLDDKHRAKSVLLNLAYIAAKDKANPLYVYNPEKVSDVSQLFSRQINQHIPVTDVQNAIAPLNTENPMDAGLMAFIQVLSQEATDPLGTGIALSPAKKGQQTATESAINQQLNDLAQSLQSKVMQFGEHDFWMDWYRRYRRYTKEGDKKIATITGVKGMSFENIDLGDMHTNFPPGVLIFSAKDAEYKELVLRRDLMQMYPELQASMTPDGMRNFNKYVFFPKFLSDPTMMDMLFPKTIDEIKAEEENDALARDVLAQVADTDNHEQHLIVHQMAKKTWATWTHMAWHEDLLAKQKAMEKAMAQAQVQPQVQQGSAKTTPDKQNPLSSATPLQQETKPQNSFTQQ